MESASGVAGLGRAVDRAQSRAAHGRVDRGPASVARLGSGGVSGPGPVLPRPARPGCSPSSREPTKPSSGLDPRFDTCKAAEAAGGPYCAVKDSITTGIATPTAASSSASNANRLGRSILRRELPVHRRGLGHQQSRDPRALSTTTQLLRHLGSQDRGWRGGEPVPPPLLKRGSWAHDGRPRLGAMARRYAPSDCRAGGRKPAIAGSPLCRPRSRRRWR